MVQEVTPSIEKKVEPSEKAEPIKEGIIKKLISYLPILSILILITSLVKASLYYYNFHLEIIHYITLSELSLLVANDLLLSIPIAVVFTTLIYFNFKLELSIYNFFTTTFPNLFKHQNKKPDKPKILKNKFWKDVLWFLGIVVIVILTDTHKVYNPSAPFYEKIGYSINLSWVIVGGYLMNIAMILDEDLANEFIITLAILLTITFFTMFMSTDVRDTAKGKYKGTKIYMNDSIPSYTSTDSAYYIGQTEKYVFFYHVNDKHTTVIPIGDIKRIELFSDSVKLK